jgi:predicted nucleic acid-binding protein
MKVFLDSSIIRDLVSPVRRVRTAANDQIGRLNRDSHDVFVPQIVLGEALSTLMRDYQNNPSEGHNTLIKLYDKLSEIMDMNTNFPSLNQNLTNCAQKIKFRDSYIKDTDALVVAHAMVEPDSNRLITSDANLIDSTAITCIEQEMRNDGARTAELRIVDSLN